MNKNKKKSLNSFMFKALGAYFSIGALMLLCIITVTLVVMSPMPGADKETIQKYKDVAAKYDGEWDLLLAYATVISNNDLSKVDPEKAGVHLLIASFDIIDELGEATHYEYRSPEGFSGLVGTSIDQLTVSGIISYINGIENVSNIEFSGKSEMELETLLTDEQYEWLTLLMADNTLVKMFGEYSNLPTSILVNSDTFFAHPCPDASIISSPYGVRYHPILKKKKFHSGIDLKGPGCYGKPVIASAGGTVIKASFDDGGYGNYIVIEHTDPSGKKWRTLYGHLSEKTVSRNDPVSRGDVIGAIGSTGRSSGPHLHFEIRYNGQTVDPQVFLRKKFSEYHGEPR